MTKGNCEAYLPDYNRQAIHYVMDLQQNIIVIEIGLVGLFCILINCSNPNKPEAKISFRNNIQVRGVRLRTVSELIFMLQLHAFYLSGINFITQQPLTAPSYFYSHI